FTSSTIATQIHLFPRTTCFTGRRYRSTSAITSSVIWTTASKPRTTRTQTGTDVGFACISHVLSLRRLRGHDAVLLRDRYATRRRAARRTTPQSRRPRATSARDRPHLRGSTAIARAPRPAALPARGPKQI